MHVIRRSLLSLLVLFLAGPAFAAVKVERDGDGRKVQASHYTARIDGQGRFTSLAAGDVELLGAPLDFGPGLKFDTATVENVEDDKVRALAKVGTGTLELLYTFTEEGVQVTATPRLGRFAGFTFTSSSRDTIAVEVLQNRATTGAELLTYVEQGEMRGVPVIGTNRVQRLRFHYRSGANLLAWHDGWGAPFNIDEIGGVNGLQWRKGLIADGKPFNLYFHVEPLPAGTARKGLPPFLARTGTRSNLVHVEEPVSFQVELRGVKACLREGAAPVAARLEYVVRDYQEREAGSGASDVSLDPARDVQTVAVPVHVRGRGFFSITFSLTAPDRVPSQYLTRFAVIAPSSQVTDRIDDVPLTKPLSDYGHSAQIGLGMVRESHSMTGFFPEKGKANWKALDEIFDRGSAESKKYGIRMLFQANSRPRWCTPEDYEQIAFDLVSRYKDRCRYWEVENEPNFSYKPEDYVRLALVPFARGAKRADPDCKVLGPGCVAVPQTLTFLEAITKAEALKYLDEVSTHTYVGPGEPWELFGNPEYLAELTRKARADGVQRPLWQTEQGYRWDMTSRSQQAAFVLRQFLQARSAGISNDQHYYFYPVHMGFEPYYLVERGSSQGWDETWEPAAAALRFSAEFLGKGPLARVVEDGHYQVIAAAQPARRLALYSLDLRWPTLVHLPAGCKAFDLMGNLLKEGPADWEVTLDGDPLYLEARDPLSTDDITALLPRNPFRSGVNWAALGSGARFTASSTSEGHPPDHAGDGLWSRRDPALGFSDQRTWWQSGRSTPTPEEPDWLQVDFPTARTVERVVVKTPLPAVEPSIRDCEVQAWVDGAWKKVAEAHAQTSWHLLLEFAPVKTDRLRLVVQRLNDGWHLDGRWMFVIGEKFTRYTAMRCTVLEMEAWGPRPEFFVQGLTRPLEPFADRSTGTLTVHNGGSQEVVFRLRVPKDTETGFTLKQESDKTYRVEAGKSLEVPVAVETQKEVSAGLVRLPLEAVTPEGKVLERLALPISVPEPVDLSLSLPRYDPRAQPIEIVVRNRLRLTWNAWVSVEGATPARLATGILDQGEPAKLKFTLKDAEGGPITVTTILNGIRSERRLDAAVRWLVVGPFPNEGGKGFEAVYGPEKGEQPDLSAEYPVAGGKMAAWKPAPIEESGFVNLLPLFTPNNNVVAYGFTLVHSPDEREALLAVGSDDGAKVWLNGQVVLAKDVTRAAEPDADRVPVHLHKGANPLLVKITQGTGGWGFYLSVLDRSGKPLGDVRLRPGS